MTEPKERWASGALYEPYVGRWSRLAAEEFLAWLDAPARLDWLDVGCGTGALTEATAEGCAPKRLVGVDRSAEFLDFARQRLSNAGADLRQADARDLPFAAGEFDRVVSGLVLNFVPDQPRAAAEMARVARHGGEVALYVWDYAGRMELMRYFWDAAVALDPQAYELDEGRRFPLCQPEPLAQLFAQAGLQDIQGRPIDIPTDFRGFDDYWSPFLGGQAPAPGYAMSLDEERRGALRDRIRSKLPIAQDGAIHLTARAWAVRGNK
jgi:ubiquinone/menaquinone biosynthesis C-methylase UbiE